MKLLRQLPKKNEDYGQPLSIRSPSENPNQSRQTRPSELQNFHSVSLPWSSHFLYSHQLMLKQMAQITGF
jgi:hypothetical protein